MPSGAELASMPPEVISHLDMAIEILKNDRATKVARLDRGVWPNGAKK